MVRTLKEYPKTWFKEAKLSKTFDVNLNRFKVVSGLSREHWIEKGWIFEEDPLGWFQWYCRFTNGRRIPYMDEIQIKRWKNFRRHVSAMKKIVKKVILVAEKDKDKLYYNGLTILIGKKNSFFFLKSIPYSDLNPFLRPNGPDINRVKGLVPRLRSTLCKLFADLKPI